MAGLPKGFVIDTPQTNTSTLPQGFKVDTAQPTQQKTSFLDTVKNVGEGMVNYAGSLPKVVAEAGLLDKPADLILKGVSKITGRKIKQDAGSFSDYAKSSQVGGDPESKTAKGVEGILNTAELLAGGAAITGGIKKMAKTSLKKTVANAAEGGTKVTAKNLDNTGKKVLDIIKESEKVGDKRAALTRGGLDETQSALSRRWKGTKNVVKPSQKSIDASATISTEIPKASTKPGVLYNQVKGKITSIAKELQPKLKDIPVQGKEEVSNMTKKILDVADEVADISKTTSNKIKTLSKNIAKSTNADEIWASLKKLDATIPKNIKKGVNLGGKDEIIYDAWRAARTEGNEVLQSLANKVGNTPVKTLFKKMSDLYHAEGQISKNIASLTPKTVGVKTKIANVTKKGIKYGIGGKIVYEGLKKLGLGGY